MYIYLLVLHALQLGLSLNAAYHSYLAIRALRQVEGTAKMAAKISSTAAEQLRRTRSTETAGALAIIASLAASTYTTVYPEPTWLALILSVGLIGGIMGARIHMLNFWEKQRSIPLVATAYNGGLERSENVTTRLSWLEIGWLTSALFIAYYVNPGRTVAY